MSNQFKEMSDSETWATLNRAIRMAAEERGYSLSRVPGRGRSNMWQVERGGKSAMASFRTTKDRWIAFVPQNGGTRFKTLDDADLVFVATVDKPDAPRRIDVFEFPADEVRERFEANYKARVGAGRAVPDDFGMWVSLFGGGSGSPAYAGSGLANEYEPIGSYAISSLLEEKDSGADDEEGDTDQIEPAHRPTTIADVLEVAREQISVIAGVRPEAVKLDLKIEY